MRLQRADRQIEALACCQRTFGRAAVEVIARVKAIAAEAITLARGEGLARSDILVLVEGVWQSLPREAADAVGGLSIALLAFCEARGLSADHCERNELARRLSLPSGPLREGEQRALGQGE